MYARYPPTPIAATINTISKIKSSDPFSFTIFGSSSSPSFIPSSSESGLFGSVPALNSSRLVNLSSSGSSPGRAPVLLPKCCSSHRLVNPSPSISLSQASPSPSPFRSSWPKLGTIGQLSISSSTPSLSLSLGAAAQDPSVEQIPDLQSALVLQSLLSLHLAGTRSLRQIPPQSISDSPLSILPF